MSRVKKHEQQPCYLIEIGKLMDREKHSQADLGSLIGVSRDRVNNWLQDTAPLDVDNLVKIAKLYSVSTDYLLGLSEIKTHDPELRAVCEYSNLSEKVIALARLTKTIPEVLNMMAEKYDSNSQNILDTPLFQFTSAFLKVVKASLLPLQTTIGRSEQAEKWQVDTLEKELGAALYVFQKTCMNLPESVLLSDTTLGELRKRSEELEWDMLLALVSTQKKEEVTGDGEHQKN